MPEEVGNKEKTYDVQIAPLMAKIIGVCKASKIAMVAQFAVPSPSDEGLLCTTILSTKEYNPPPHMVEAAALLRRAGRPSPVVISVRNGEEQIVSQEVIL